MLTFKLNLYFICVVNQGLEQNSLECPTILILTLTLIPNPYRCPNLNPNPNPYP